MVTNTPQVWNAAVWITKKRKKTSTSLYTVQISYANSRYIRIKHC